MSDACARPWPPRLLLSICRGGAQQPRHKLLLRLGVVKFAQVCSAILPAVFDTVLSCGGRTGGRFPCVVRICSMHSSLLVTPVQGLAAVPLAGNLCSVKVFRSPGLRNSLGTNSPLNWMPVMFSWLSPFREFLLCVLTRWGSL